MSTITRADAEPLAFSERLVLALETCRMVYESRDEFLSDDDVLDITAAWTTSDLVAFYEATGECPSEAQDEAAIEDYESLRDTVFDILTTRGV